MGRLTGRVALVTGGASGIRAATAQRLADEGATVVITDIQDDRDAVVAAGVRSRGGAIDYLQHDVASEAAWTDVVTQIQTGFGQLDILFNNAGIGEATPIEDTTREAYLHTVGITQHSVFLGMRACAALLKASGRASIINNSSIFGKIGRAHV